LADRPEPSRRATIIAILVLGALVIGVLMVAAMRPATDPPPIRRMNIFPTESAR
jgi:hypothetical protein